ncbi:MAG: ATPase, partial [Gemmatimonadota bacterium]
RRVAGGEMPPLAHVASATDVLDARRLIGGLYLDEKIEDYIVELVHATRDPLAHGLADLVPLIEYGASPRASIYLAVCSRAHAFLRGREYVLPEDVKAVGPDVLRHRIITSFEADAEEIGADDVVARIFGGVSVP